MRSFYVIPAFDDGGNDQSYFCSATSAQEAAQLVAAMLEIEGTFTPTETGDTTGESTWSVFELPDMAELEAPRVLSWYTDCPRADFKLAEA